MAAVLITAGCATQKHVDSDSGFFCGVLTSAGDRILLSDCATDEPLMLKGGEDYEKAVSSFREVDEDDGPAYIHFYGTIERVTLRNGGTAVSSVSVDKFEDMYLGVTCNRNALLTKPRLPPITIPYVSVPTILMSNGAAIVETSIPEHGSGPPRIRACSIPTRAAARSSML